MDEVDYFAVLRSMVSLKGKHVLEIGGSVPPALIAPCGVASWTSIDINQRRFIESLNNIEIPKWYCTEIMSACEMTFDREKFDVVYSTNCFEHISDLPLSLEQIYRVLRPKGILFTIFGPIWSGSVGHHTWVWDNGKPLTFSDNVFPDWFHLTHNEEELKLYLKERYRPEIVEAILKYVYRSDDINRLVDSVYEREIASFDYSHIINLKIRSLRGPNRETLRMLKDVYRSVSDFRTLGYFWVYVKGRCELRFRLRAYLWGGLAILRRKTLEIVRNCFASVSHWMKRLRSNK